MVNDCDLNKPSASRAYLGVWLIGAFALAVLPLVALGWGGTSEANDQVKYHLPLIHEMQTEWPNIDIVNYDSATAPGYHAVLAAIGATTGANDFILRLVNALVGIGLVYVVYRVARYWSSDAVAVLLVLPIAASTYVISGAVWLTTDNAALLFVAASLGVLMAETISVRRLLWAGLWASVAVSIRQVFIWLVIAIGVVGLVEAVERYRSSPADRIRPVVAILGATVLTCAAPAAVVLFLVSRWNGLTPPSYQAVHEAGVNLATFVFSMALLGAFGVFFLPVLGRRVLADLTDGRVWIPGVFAFLAGWVAESSYLWPLRAGGSLWSLVKAFPSLSDRSVLLPFLAAIGATTLVILGRSAIAAGKARQVATLVAAFASLTVVQSLNSILFQRYLEVLVLVILAWLTAMSIRPTDGASRWKMWWIGPAVLAAGQFGISLLNVYLVALRSGLG